MSETVTHASRQCPRCGRQLPPDAPEGLCASCLLIAGAELLTGSNQSSATDLTSMGHPPRSPGAPRLADGQVWGPYRVVRLLGRGGMGEVYEAEQLETGRRLALKVLRDTLRSAEDRARFLREGQLAASISHEHTVYIFGSEEVGGAPAITMELLPGGTLKDRVLAGGPMSPVDAVSAVLDIIGGLDAAQAAGILHRDIKPSNCFIDADGGVKVGDFGLSLSTLTRDVRHELATTGFEGTPQFAAPEQFRGEPLDVRADIYAVGATLYYLLTGRPPLDSSDLQELVSKVASETPASPRTPRRDVPRGLAAIVLRCLAKTPDERPQSYAELAGLLRPYGSTRDVASPLGTRLIAWIVDWTIISIVTWLLTVSGWTVSMTLGSFALLQLSAWSWIIPAAYYLVLEGGWGASLGKRIMGLRVTARADAGWWRRIAVRTVIFHVPSAVPALLSNALFAIGNSGSIAYTDGPAPNGWYWQAQPYVLLSLLPLLLTVLLFATARRSNHWTGVHELLSGTRVVQRHASRDAVSPGLKTFPIDLVPTSTSSLRIGPYVAHTIVGETGGGRLLVGIDPILRRHVWIHEVPPGTPPIDAARRDVSRPGRLYWLAGRRSATENWDAFEAPRGEPFLAAPPSSDWRQVHDALLSLATELEASADDGARFTLGHLWSRAHGQLVLLDFPWPASATPVTARTFTPVELLAAVSRHAWVSVGEPAAPLSGITLLHRLASHVPPPLANVRAELLRLASIPSRPSRVRRALPIVMGAMPLTAMVLIVTVMLPMFARSLQDDGNVFRQRSEIMRWMMWLDDRSADADLQTDAQRTAAEQYLAARFRDQLTSDAFWSTQMPPIEPFLGMRRRAADIAARYPTVSPTELAQASAIVAPQIQELAQAAAHMSANFPTGLNALRGFVTNGFASLLLLVPFVCGLISAVAVPGGLVTRALRHAVVTRDGREIGRMRSVMRFLIAWSPALVWIACVGNPIVGDPLVSPDTGFAVGGVALVLITAGAAWTIANPSRAPHDRIARTWVVSR